MQYAVQVAGVDSIGIDILGQGDHALERSFEQFAAIAGGTVFHLQPAFAGQRQQVLLQRGVEALRIEACRKQVDVDTVRAGADIDRRERAPTDGGYRGCWVTLRSRARQ